MSADSPPEPPVGGPGAATDWLRPRLWRPPDQPSPAEALNRAAQDNEAPLLLLIDRRQALPAGGAERLAACLSPEEHQRHEAFHLAADRQRFLLGRGGLRSLLGAWLGLAPADVPLENGAHGKPLCPIGPHFNVSHSGELILLAVHPMRPVGVDVERRRPQLDWPAIARRMFSASELQDLERIPASQRPEAFLAIWCRLESRLKAHGTGLAGLEKLRRQERQTGGSAAHDAGATGDRIWDVHVPAGYRAAVALASAL